MRTESALNYVKDNSLILLILFLGFVLRIYDLGGESLWLDEVFSVEMSRLSLIDMVKVIISEGDNYPPFYYMIMHFWVALFGDSEAATRLFSALVGTVSIFVIYKLGKLLFNKNIGLTAALILATSVFQVKYSQEVRAYALMGLLSMLSVYFFVRLLLNNGDIKYSLGYLVSSFLLVYTHYFGSLIIVAQNFYFFSIVLIDYDKGKQYGFKRWIFLQSILVFLSLPELFLLAGATALQEDFWIPKPNVKGLIGTFLKYSGSIPLLTIFSILSLMAVVNSAAFMCKKRFRGLLMSQRSYSTDLNLSNINRVYLLIVLILIPMLLPFIFSQFTTPIYHVRYMIGASVAFYLIVAKGIENIVAKRLKFGLIGLVVAMSVFNVGQYYGAVDKEQWRDAVEYIEDNAGPGELILVYPDYVSIAAQYYLKRKDLMLVPLRKQSELDFDITDTNLWIVLSDHSDVYNIEKEILSQDRGILKEKGFKRLKVYLLNMRTD